jgi:6-phosphogluconolactonase
MMQRLLLVIVLIWACHGEARDTVMGERSRTCHADAQMLDPGRPAGNDTLVYIGTHTGEKSKGIYVFRLQSAGTEVFQNVTLVPLGLAAEAVSPTYFEIDLKKRRLFTVNEIDQFNGKPTGAVSAFAIDSAGKLTLLNQRASMGPRPCQLALEPQARYVLVANCDNGHTAVFPIGEDGRIGEPTDRVQHGGKGTPCLAFDPSSRFVVICDRASDKVLTYQFDAQTGKLTPSPAKHQYASAGSGPRHVVFRQDGRFVYLLNEHRSTITVFSHDAGALTPVQTVSTLPEYFEGANVAGELHIHRSGKWLYASNVGHNSIVLFTIDAERGTLTFVEEQGTGGKTPRQFGIEPSSKHLAISNRDSDTVLASRIDEGNGRLKPSGIFADLASPAAIRFLPPQQ